MLAPVDGRRRFRGELAGTEGDSVRIRSRDAGERGDFLLPINDMSEAKLMLTDALISEALRRSKHGEREADGQGDGARRQHPRQPQPNHLKAALDQDRRTNNPRETD